MRMWQAGAVIAAVVLLALPAFAGTAGGPCVEQGKLEVGYDMNYSRRHFDLDSITNNVSTLGWTNGEIRQLHHAATVSYGFSDMFEGQVRLGVNHLNRFKDEASQPNDLILYDKYTFDWGIGGKATIPAVFAMIDLTIGAQYNQTKYKDLDGNFQQANDADLTDVHLDLSEWQVDVIGSTKYQQITPYLGFRYSDARADLEVRSRWAGAVPADYTAKYEASHNWGGLAGADIEFTPELGGYVEGTFVDDNAFSLGVNYKF